MQICPTRALWRFSAIPTPVLTNCFSPFRLLRKDQFPDLVRSLEDLGDDYIENDFTSPTTEEIRNARPIAAVLPQDVMTHATLVATTIFAGAEDNRAHREVRYVRCGSNTNRVRTISIGAQRSLFRVALSCDYKNLDLPPGATGR